MAMQPVLFLSVLIFTVVDASLHSHLLSKCVRRCEHENSCHSSLESFSCEATCKSMCECSERSKRMLNKPRNCQPAMLEEQKKQLSLIRSKAHVSKVKLADEQSQPDQFEGYIALEDFWPKAMSVPNAKPRMLNGDHSLSLLNKKAAEPWSVAARPHAHRHGSLAQIKKATQKPSNASNASRASNTSQAVIAAKKDDAPTVEKSNASQSLNTSKVSVAAKKDVAPTRHEEGKLAPTKKDEPVPTTGEQQKKSAPTKIQANVTR